MYAENKSVEFKELIGKTFSKVFKNKYFINSIVFQLKDSNSGYILYHDQDCCEDVSIEDICGDLSDLENTEILDAYCTENFGNDDISETWAFYNIRTIKGSVTIRWYGTSNGCYSEKADLYACREI
ncbi:hypothetical protein M0R19_03535 [Candidatus Pacearchaeota archaeon]|nr:hypothetical protein [Candidatus Pacearchaeota archaeon]